MKKQKLILLLKSLRHISLKQIYYRLYFLSRKNFWGLFSLKAPLPAAPPLRDLEPFYKGITDVIKIGPWAEQFQIILERGKNLSDISFKFLNHSKSYSGEPVWDDNSVSQLYRYHLHYFNYVTDLLLKNETMAAGSALDTFKFLCTSWIEKNRKLKGDGWHSYTLSLRIVNWINFFYQCPEYFQADPEFYRNFSNSLYGQAKILASSLERDVRGNHLLKNLKALLWTGSVFESEEADSWFDNAIGFLKKELAEQILPDGCHFERTPGYHVMVLTDCIEIGLLFRRYRKTAPPAWIDSSIEKMLSFLSHIMQPEAQLPLLKDTTSDQNPKPDEVLAAGAFYLNRPDFKVSDHWGLYPLLLFGYSAWQIFNEWPKSEQLSDFSKKLTSGYYVLRDLSKDDYLIVDAGAVCPEYLPAHAHADMLNYELVIKGRRVIVDSGVYEYQAGAWRDYFRSTRAHNTVEINRENQSEVWSSFRVARRARALNVAIQTGKNHVLLEASHDGYTRLSVSALHRRIFAWQKGLFWVFVDEVLGQGSVAATSYIHLHPDIEAVQMDSFQWQLKGLPFALYIKAFGIKGSELIRGQMKPFLQGWYSEQFGIRSPNTVIALHKNESLPLVFGYLVTSDDFIDIDAVASGASGTEVRIDHCGQEYKLRIENNEVKYTS